MGDNQHGHTLFCKVLHNGENFSNHFRVESRCRLVEEKHFRVHRQCSGDRHTLLLSAGELPGLGIHIGGHAHLFQVVHCRFLGFSLASAQHLLLTYHTVFQHGHIEKQVKGLEHHTHIGTVLGSVEGPLQHILAPVDDLPGSGGFQQVDTAKQCGFAGTGSADNGHHIAFFYFKIHICQHLMGAKAFGEVVYRQNHIFHLTAPFCILCCAHQSCCHGWGGYKCLRS